MNAPTSVDQGADIPIEVLVESTVAQAGRITLRQDDEIVGTSDVDLLAGSNRITFAVPSADTGLSTFTATVDTANDNRAENDTARTTVDVDGPAEVLIVEGIADGGAALAAALRSTGLEVDVIRAAAVPDLETLIRYDSTVLVNVSADQLSNTQMEDLSTATRQLARGLVTVGGPQSLSLIHI